MPEATFYNAALMPLTACAYFYFNWQYFMLAKAQAGLPRLRLGLVIFSFLLTFSVFVLCSLLELHLVFNWLSFALLLYAQTLLYTRGDSRGALYSALFGIIYALAINIFCRSAIALLTNTPLMSFDNQVLSGQSLKGLPILLGFLLAGVALRALRRPAYVAQARLILSYPKHQAFLLEVMAGLLLYLYLNLLLYSVPLNDLLLKVWSIKSALFSLIGVYIAMRYAWRICELADYRRKNLSIEQELRLRRQEELQLLQQSARDPLTGAYNRQYAEEAIRGMLKGGLPFSLCFIDLDGLKAVNDQYGHTEGDRYLKLVAEQLGRACRKDKDRLFRYGGDEFLIVFADTPAAAAAERAESVNRALAEQGLKYPASISYGAAWSGSYADMEALLQAADGNMYAQKQGKRIAREV